MNALANILTPTVLKTAGLLIISNTFMLFAWYGHLRNLASKPVWIAVIASWSIALLEYAFQVPANRLGATALDVGQLKIMQEVITLCVFIPFSVFYMKQPIKPGFIWAGLCMLAAVWFVFRDQ